MSIEAGARSPLGKVLVKRGSSITIEIKRNGVTVRARGKAEQDGRLGDEISVLPIDGNRLIKARVVSSGFVEVVL